MARPVQFDGQNGVLGAPPNAQLEVQPLPVYRNGKACISCWELSEDEVREIIMTRQIYLSVHAGISQPPVFIGSRKQVREVVGQDGQVWFEE